MLRLRGEFIRGIKLRGARRATANSQPLSLSASRTKVHSPTSRLLIQPRVSRPNNADPASRSAPVSALHRQCPNESLPRLLPVYESFRPTAVHLAGDKHVARQAV